MSSLLDKWRDLHVRVMSAIVMLAIAGLAIGLGKTVFAALIACVSGVMFWELQTMHHPKRQWLAIVLAVCMAAIGFLAGFQGGLVGPKAMFLGLGFLPVLALASANVTGHRKTVLAYGFCLICACLMLQIVLVSIGFGLLAILLGTVVITDIAGYFFGRFLGGPKFWPSISPKKTWAGILGGWGCAGVFGWSLVHFGDLPFSVVPNIVLMSFASQLGDIVESAIKRRADVKDSSNLIPGHGGFLDRFDGVIGATFALIGILVVLL